MNLVSSKFHFLTFNPARPSKQALVVLLNKDISQQFNPFFLKFDKRNFKILHCLVHYLAIMRLHKEYVTILLLLKLKNFNNINVLLAKS